MLSRLYNSNLYGARIRCDATCDTARPALQDRAIFLPFLVVTDIAFARSFCLTAQLSKTRFDSLVTLVCRSLQLAKALVRSLQSEHCDLPSLSLGFFHAPIVLERTGTSKPFQISNCTNRADSPALWPLYRVDALSMTPTCA